MSRALGEGEELAHLHPGTATARVRMDEAQISAPLNDLPAPQRSAGRRAKPPEGREGDSTAGIHVHRPARVPSTRH